METKITPVKFELTRSEYYTYISDFPDMQRTHAQPGDLPQKQVILDHLRKELVDLTLKPNQIENKLCYRNCFKWANKDHINFCLDKKCGNPGFEQAAKVLNYLK